MKKGKEYEILIENLYRQLEPNANIVQDDHIYGKDSNTMRQIDVSIRYKFLGLDHLIIVQAKDYKISADINKVGEFLSVVKDVGANKGILICAKGFTKKAIEYAKNKGIELLTIHSASNKNWEILLKVKISRVIHEFEMIGNFDLDASHIDYRKAVFDNDVFSYDGATIISFTDVLDRELLQKKTLKELKNRHGHFLDLGKLKLKHVLDGKLVPLVRGYTQIKYIRTLTKGILIKPVNYLYEVNHLSLEKKLHNLTITVDNLEDICTCNTKGYNEALSDPDIESVIYKFNEAMHITFQFKRTGRIIGHSFSRGNTISKLDDRAKRILELEEMLKFQ